MVLPNFECWATMSSEQHLLNGGTDAVVRHVDPFNPRAISSNGYYGFSMDYFSAAHEPAANHTNNNNNNNNNHNNINKMGNDVNDMSEESAVAVAAAAVATQNAMRCKKRTFGNSAAHDAFCMEENLGALVNNGIAPKRCRIDESDDDATLRYFKDFFALPTTNHCNTDMSSCLMDTEEFCTNADAGLVIQEPVIDAAALNPSLQMQTYYPHNQHLQQSQQQPQQMQPLQPFAQIMTQELEQELQEQQIQQPFDTQTHGAQFQTAQQQTRNQQQQQQQQHFQDSSGINANYLAALEFQSQTLSIDDDNNKSNHRHHLNVDHNDDDDDDALLTAIHGGSAAHYRAANEKHYEDI